MKAGISYLVLCAALLAVLLCFGKTIVAVETEKVTVVGTVSVTEDDDWNITAAKLTTNVGVVYHITLDAKGKAFAEKMDMEEAEVMGTVHEKNGAKWLTVLSYKKVAEEGDDD